MRSLLFLCCVLVASAACLAGADPVPAPATAPTTQPPRVFRCVLDGNPRMLVIDFHNGVMAAFDTQKCELVKVWRGDVEFTGTVYDTKHGPQPRSRGEALYAKGQGGRMPLALAVMAHELNSDRVWHGYSIADSSVVLRSSTTTQPTQVFALVLSAARSDSDLWGINWSTPEP